MPPAPVPVELVVDHPPEECERLIAEAICGSSGASGWPWLTPGARNALYGRAGGGQFTLFLAPTPGGTYNRLALSGELRAFGHEQTLVLGRLHLRDRSFWRAFRVACALALTLTLVVVAATLMNGSAPKADGGESLLGPALIVPPAITLGGWAMDRFYTALAFAQAPRLEAHLARILDAR